MILYKLGPVLESEKNQKISYSVVNMHKKRIYLDSDWSDMAYNSRWNLYIFLVCEIDPHLLTAVASCNEAEILAEQAAVLSFS